MAPKSRFNSIVRWICVFPVACFAAWGAWFIVMVGNRLTIGSQGVDPDAFLMRAFIEAISHGAMGAAFIYFGAKVAPTKKKVVAYALAGVGLVSSGFSLFPAFMISNYWAVWSGLSTVIGLAVTAYSVSTDDIYF
jgi:hypothetical protein